MAFHMLIGNYDVETRNAFLYSPQNVNRFYYLSWDNDVCFTKTEYELRGVIDGMGKDRGVSNYWGIVLFNRALRLASFREALDAAVNDLAENYIARDTVAGMVERYKAVVEPYVYNEPDILYAPLTQVKYDEVAAAIPDEVEENLASYRESLLSPLPFYIGTPKVENGTLSMGWDASYDFDAQAITYRATLARDPQCEDVVAQGDDLVIPLMTCDNPGTGEYFLRVVAVNEDGYTQTAFDTYVTANDGNKAYGTICFWITDDDKVVLYNSDDENGSIGWGSDVAVGAADEGADVSESDGDQGDEDGDA